MCRFSLIVCTVTRTAELEAFLGSLAAQKQPPAFEVIVVDQNPDDRLAPLLDRCRGRFPVRRLRSEIGLSRARNVGLAAASGDIVAIPDDDCTYPPDLLHRLAAYFDANPGCDGVSTLVTDRDGSFSAGGYMAGSPLAIDRGNIWRTAVSPSIFVRRSAVGEVRFDETLGVGSGTVYGSGEESDFLLQLLEHHRRLDYRPEFVVHHPCFHGPWRAERGRLYGNGMGRVLRKHRYPAWRAVFYASLQFVRAVQFLLKLNPSRSRFHLAMALGRLHGYFHVRH